MKKMLFPKWGKWFTLSLTFLAIYGLARAYYRITDDFRMGNITHNVPYHPDWDVPPLSPLEQAGLDVIFSQKYTYLGKGAQSYAFLSKDGNFVLKLFKSKHSRPSFLVELLPPISSLGEFKEKERARKIRKFESTLDGYKLAFDQHKNSAALLYIHLNKTNYLGKTVRVKDKLGLTWTLPLDDMVFVVQQKARKLRDVVREHLESGDIDGAKRRIRQIFDMYAMEYGKGIYDRDHGVMHNTGFVENRPIHLDVGKLSREEQTKTPSFQRKDIRIVVTKIDRYMKSRYPQYRDEMAASIEEHLSTLFGEPFLL